ncbi:30S ribosome-binding factor RbfA [Deinococcus koreensis]|uniref:Ribosome-binding factor A n=1 Tax=Deinococcus koreensis TaxID=2054903 RepID=A0A2K3UVH7_9DEIO|nr:30S ribosome-binding factor RbfA [Deinococcus koreensis]PNY80549.1 30S ribosome-binding factor RbfA [Deinococcus koreensis]
MKPEQVQSQLSRVLGEAISGLSDPRVPLIVTIERVAVTSDYGQARVYVSAMTGNMDDLLQALNQARGYLQRQVADQVRLRRTPTLEFFDAGGKVW